MRLDLFLPFLKKAKKGSEPPRNPWIIRAARKILPTSFFANQSTGKPGLIRRLLTRIGPTWLSSPVRRFIQGVCLVAFLILFFYVCWPYDARPGANETGWPSHHADNFLAKERLDAEAFLAIDPLVPISTALAGRTWVWSLWWSGLMLLVCVAVPRGFCGYLCPLGTLIDLFDWSIGKRITRFRVQHDGWWVHLKYYVLLATLISALCGVLVSGLVAAIPVLTRGLLFTLAPLQMGAMKGWHLIPPMNAGHFLSIALFLAVLGLGLLRPRFWCRYVCPSGAVFSIGNLFRVSERKVESTCINCNKCIEICPFDAIKADFTTREADCTLCQTCGGVCPTHAIKFVERWNTTELKVLNDPPTHEIPLSRRAALTATAGGVALFAGIHSIWGANLASKTDEQLPVRPPGTVPEADFLNLCIRCGECFKACPNNVLQPLGFELGFEGLWTPAVKANWSGCEPSCNNCGQVCPTGAIRALSLDEKRVARMGLAVVNPQTCLPHAGREACQLCVDECNAAGYHAIDFIRVGTETDADGTPIEETGFLAPVVNRDTCVGCGLCQTRCHGINVEQKGLLTDTAILITTENQDRLHRGSYSELRKQEQEIRQQTLQKETDGESDYLPDFLK
ncbi:MAG: 4Fe-4S ferredoxin iron-sulfur binding domain protein [Planctomycetaceae bacterium]|nr:4Fe-4S ferredoxin iron-sulfur binding domain protein [Planctomycetaceae bacterium]